MSSEYTETLTKPIESRNSLLAQRNELVKAVLAAVITFRAYVGMGSWTVGGRVGGAGGGPAIVAASRVVGGESDRLEPPHNARCCRHVVRACRRGSTAGRDCREEMHPDDWRGHRRSREALGLRVRPDDSGQSSRGSVIRQGFQTCMGRGRRSCYRSGVDRAPLGMCDRVDHGVLFRRAFCSGGADGGIESINAVGSGSGNSVLKIRFGRLPSRVEGRRSKVRLSCVPFFKDTGPIRDKDLVQSGGDSQRNCQGDGLANALV